MKIALKIYFLVLLFVYGIFLWSSFNHIEVWMSPITWLNWFVNVSGLSALFFIAFGTRIVSEIFWRGTLVLMLIVYSFQLIRTPLFAETATATVIVTVLLNYLLLVAPLFFSVFFLCIKRTEHHKLD